MTGRAAGYCGGTGAPGYAEPAPGRGFGYGRGRGFGGRGWRHMVDATGRPGWARFGRGAVPYGYRTPETETEALRNQAETLRTELDAIEKRLSEIRLSGEAAKE